MTRNSLHHLETWGFVPGDRAALLVSTWAPFPNKASCQQACLLARLIAQRYDKSPPPRPLEGGPSFCNITIRFWQSWMDQPHCSLSRESGKCFLMTCRWNDHLAQSYAEQGTPTPRPSTGTSPRPVRNMAAYPEANYGPARSLHVLSTNPTLLTWQRNCLPWNRSLEPQSRGLLMYRNTLTVCVSQGSPEKQNQHSVRACNVETIIRNGLTLIWRLTNPSICRVGTVLQRPALHLLTNVDVTQKHPHRHTWNNVWQPSGHYSLSPRQDDI